MIFVFKLRTPFLQFWGKVEDSATSKSEPPSKTDEPQPPIESATSPGRRKLDLRSVVREVVAMNLSGSTVKGRSKTMVLNKEGKLVKGKRRRRQPAPLANLNQIYKRKKNHKVDRLGQDKVTISLFGYT